MAKLRKKRFAGTSNHGNGVSVGKNFEDGDSSRIAEGAEIQGELEFSGSLSFAGKFEGSIKAEEGDLELSRSGVIQGDIHCQIIDCFGQVYGNIQAQTRGLLHSDCKLIGDIVTKCLRIQNGAQVSGYCKMLEGHSNMDFFSMPIDKLRKHLQSELRSDAKGK